MDLSLNIRRLARDHGIKKTAELAKAAGFDALDCFIELDRDDCPFHAENFRSIAEDMRRTSAAEGMRFNQTHAPFRFPAKRWEDEDHFDVFVKSLEISALLGAELCVIHPLHHMEYLGHEEEIFELNMKYYRKLIPYCKEFGVKVGIENMWQKHRIRKNISFDTCSTVREFVRYIDTLDSDCMKACLDIGHVVLPDNPDSPADFIRALGHDRLAALHVHDNDYTNDSHLIPYMGKLDWDSITKALGEINYAGDLTYELSDATFAIPEQLVKSVLNYAGAVGKYLVKKTEDNRIK